MGVLLIVLAIGGWQALHLNLETDITQFLPDSRQRQQLALAGLVRSSAFSNGMILDIELPSTHKSTDTVDSATGTPAGIMVRGFLDDIRARELVTKVTSGESEGMARAWYDIMFTRRFALISKNPSTEIPDIFSAQGLTQRIEQLKQRLALPGSEPVRMTATRDPINFFFDRAELVSKDLSQLRPKTVDGLYFSDDGRHVIAMVEVEPDPYDVSAQVAITDGIRTAFDHANATAGGGYTLRMTGLNRFVAANQTRAKNDVAWAGTISSILVVGLFLLFFRRLIFIPLAFLPVACGIVAGIGAVMTLKGSIHGLTLGFGSTLIGVVIDYPIHILSSLSAHDSRSADGDFATSRRHLFKHLLAGVITTLAGFAALLFSDYPGIREIAIFNLTGITMAFAVSTIFLPGILARLPRQKTSHILLQSLLVIATRWIWPARVTLASLLVAAFAILPHAHLEDSAQALNATDKVLTDEDATIRSHLPAARFPVMVLVEGKDAEEALQRNDIVADNLMKLNANHQIGQFASLATIMPSKATQQVNLETLAALDNPGGRVRIALESAGFNPDAFALFFSDLDDARRGKVDLLDPEDLENTPLEDIVSRFMFDSDGRTWVLTLATSGVDEIAPALLLPNAPSAVMAFRQSDLVSSVITSSQLQTLGIFLAGVALNIVLIALYRRRLLPTLATLTPTLLTIALVPAGLVSAGIALNLLHIVGLLLVLSMGIDYAVFLVGNDDDTGQDQSPTNAVAWTGVLLSALTTGGTFLALATCSTPALVSVGVTVGAGIIGVLVLTIISNMAFKEVKP